jgi:hypothetical protein
MIAQRAAAGKPGVSLLQGLIAAVNISLRLELVRVFVHLNHIAASSKNANHEIMGALFRDMFVSVQLLEIRGS